MKPFDLKQALAGAPLRTRDGHPAMNFRLDERTRNSYDYRYAFELQGFGVFHCSPKGTYWLTKQDPLDLFMEG